MPCAARDHFSSCQRSRWASHMPTALSIQKPSLQQAGQSNPCLRFSRITWTTTYTRAIFPHRGSQGYEGAHTVGTVHTNAACAKADMHFSFKIQIIHLQINIIYHIRRSAWNLVAHRMSNVSVFVLTCGLCTLLDLTPSERRLQAHVDRSTSCWCNSSTHSHCSPNPF